METIDVPLSEIKKSRLYKRLEAEGRLGDPLPTADEMRAKGYVINPYTWPAMGNGRPLEWAGIGLSKGHDKIG